MKSIGMKVKFPFHNMYDDPVDGRRDDDDGHQTTDVVVLRFDFSR